MRGRYQEKSFRRLLMLLKLKEGYSVDEIEIWRKGIQKSGIICMLQDIGELVEEKNGQTMIARFPAYHSDDTLVLTDSREIAKACLQKGYVCIGLDPDMEHFFDGAEAVVSSVLDLDLVYMKETFLRAKGVPVVIAETDRICIREMTKEDLHTFYEISRQDGMEEAFADPEQAECFTCERMEAYISTVYRFYGYGWWVVETQQGEMIGGCGLSDFSLTENKAEYLTENQKTGAEQDEILILFKKEKDTEKTESEVLLELQYFVANHVQNQGYGTEMCTAVMKYAQERLSDYEICIRVHKRNTASVRLARKLGFHCRASAMSGLSGQIS